jgi:hypothetical protein
MTALRSLNSLKRFIELSSLSLPCFATSAQQLLLESPCKSAKLPAYLINWISISDIKRELKKYGEEEGTGQTIKHHLSSLLSKFPTGDIKNALVAILAKLELDVKDLPTRKNKLIELFSQLLYDKMFIMADLTKSATRYVLSNYSGLK